MDHFKIKIIDAKRSSFPGKWMVDNFFSQESESQVQDVSIIVKASHQASFYRRMTPITRPFVKEVFWFKHAHPELAKLYPEISKISPVCYYASSNYIDSFMGRDMVEILTNHFLWGLFQHWGVYFICLQPAFFNRRVVGDFKRVGADFKRVLGLTFFLI